jgi:hypothetical protein
MHPLQPRLAARRPTLSVLATLLAIGCNGATFETPAGGSGGGSAGTPSVVQPVCTEGATPPAPARLLTRVQYDNTVRDLLGDTTAPGQLFPPEPTVLGFENNSDVYQATPLLVEDLMKAAEGVAARAVAVGAAALAQCEGGVLDAACGARFIQNFGKRAFRRPLTTNEAALFSDLLERTARAEGYDRGIELTLQAMLQSPQFLYRIDTQLSAEPGAVKALGPYEVASRLSYFLWGSLPDDALFAAAENDELSTSEQIADQAQRLLEDPRARSMVADFHRQWLGLDRLNSVVREVAVGTEVAGLGPSLKASLLEFSSFMYWEGGGNVQSLFSSPSFFVDGVLAPHFGVTATADQPLTRVDDTSPRAGLLTQPALLAMFAHENQSAPILRGAFIRERLMCQPVPPPPPTVNNTPPEPRTTGTTRERFIAHSNTETCRACHALFDDLGFALENYDQLGRYRSEENGAMLNVAGEVTQTVDPALAGPFNGPLELAAKFAASPQISDCLATQWYRYAMGRVETDVDQCSLQTMQRAATEANGDLKTMLLALVQTDAFRFRAALPEETP